MREILALAVLIMLLLVVFGTDGIKIYAKPCGNNCTAYSYMFIPAGKGAK